MSSRFQQSILAAHSSPGSVGDLSSVPPPAYSLSTTQEDHKRRSATSTLDARCVRICLHQILSFGRFQDIANLPNISSGIRLEALIKLPSVHHDQSKTGIHNHYNRVRHQEQTLRLCTPTGGKHDTLPPCSFNTFCFERHLQPASGFFPHTDCQWTTISDNKESIRKCLEKSSI